jgi:transcription initiation factor TFIIIB Brf1 subunit/transcription initiation factor TFIIB
MDESGSRNCNKGEERASSLPKKRRRGAKRILAKPKERKRGFVIAKLERMRVEEEMKVEEEVKEYFKEGLSQQLIHGAGIQGLVSLLV